MSPQLDRLMTAQVCIPTPAQSEPHPRRGIEGRLRLFVGAIAIGGSAAIAWACAQIVHEAFSPYMLLLAITTVVSGRFRIKVPGRAASVSVSEVFVFASVLLFGPAPATLTVALDGLWISLTQRDRRLYRSLFNIGEPAISTILAGTAFTATLAAPLLGHAATGSVALIAPTIAMAVVYFALNSSLTSIAVALESGGSPFPIWKSHALPLAMNYYAAASVASLVVRTGSDLDFGLVGLMAPLLALSYGAYRAVANREQDTQRHLQEVRGLYQATVETLAIAVDAKDQVTHGHIRRVQRHTVAVARAMGVTNDIDIRALAAASLLHDVGKLAVPDYVLNKPGSLSPAEFETIKLHAAKGAEILTAVAFPYEVVPVVRHHHEQWNGKGYPDGLAGEEIPFGARILTVVDCFDAVTSDRPYRRKMTDEEGIAVLRSRRGTMYDPRVVDAFVALVPSLRRDDALAETSAAQAVPVEEISASVRPTPEANPGQPSAAEQAIRVCLASAFRAERLAKVLPGAEACLFAPDTSAEFLVAVCVTPKVRDAVADLRLRVGEGLAGWVAANRHTIINSHADLDLGPAAEQLELKACTATPVFALGELVGVLSVYLPPARRFSETEIRAVGALAQEIGLRIASQSYAFELGWGTAAVSADTRALAS